MERRLEVRVQAELLELFDKACEANYTTRSEVLRQAMLEYVRQNQKGVNEVKKIEVVIIEAGIDYTSRLEGFMMNVTGGDEVEKAIAEVEKKGYKVIPNDQGGQNEMCTVTGGSDYIAVTVEPK